MINLTSKKDCVKYCVEDSVYASMWDYVHKPVNDFVWESTSKIVYGYSVWDFVEFSLRNWLYENKILNFRQF